MRLDQPETEKRTVPSCPTLRFSWRMPAAGTVRFTGSVQAGGARAIGNWIDDHGDDGGVVLIRLR